MTQIISIFVEDSTEDAFHLKIDSSMQYMSDLISDLLQVSLRFRASIVYTAPP